MVVCLTLSPKFYLQAKSLGRAQGNRGCQRCYNDETRQFGTKQYNEEPRIEQTSRRGFPWTNRLATNETDYKPGEFGLVRDVSLRVAKSQLHRVGDEV